MADSKISALTSGTPVSGDVIPFVHSGANYKGDVSALPISTATQSALDAKASASALSSHVSDTANPHSVTKAQVGLSNVPNLDTTAAVADAHTHSNKTVLDGISSAPVESIVAGTNVTVTRVWNSVTVNSSGGGGGGTGDVVWPASATDNAIARFDTTTGKLVQNSVVTVGDTGNVSGINDILSANSVGLSLTPASVPTTVGTTYWNATENCMETPYSADVSLSHGLEMYVRVVNKTGATVTDGTTVYVDGAQGNRPTIQKAKADSLATTRVIGVATQDIANNAEGFVTVFGNVHGYDTSGFTAGDPLYVSATTAGALTNVAPSSPNYVVFVGRALNSTVNGLIHVNPRAPIDADVNLGTDPVAATEGAVKSYVDTAVSSKVPTSRTLTINGVTYDLSADRSWTIATGWTKQIRIRIPGQLVADTSNYQGLFWYNDTGSTITISNVGFFVGLAAQGTGAAAAFNVYKSSGTSTDGINTSAVNLFTSAVDLTTNYASATNVPNTATVESGRWVSIRCTSSAGATRKASDAEVVITYS